MTDLRLFDSPGSDVAQITTDGSTIKPFLAAILSADDEAKITVGPEGSFSTRLVDPSNVYMVDVTLDASAFDGVGVERETTLGVNVRQLKRLVRRARVNHDDTLELHVSEREITTEVSRGYGNHEVVSQGTMDLIDPESIRDKAAEDVYAHDTQTVTVDREPLLDALDYLADGPSKHAEVSLKGVNQHTDALYIGNENDILSERIAITGVETDEPVESIYSMDYLTEVRDVIRAVKPETVTIDMADEFPMTLSFESGGLSAKLTVAPNIQS